MARLGKIEALVLSRRNLGEADRLLTFFSREYGVIRVVAKGVRRIPSRRGGHLELHSRVWGVLHGRARRAIAQGGPYFLAGVETLDAYPALHNDRGAWEQAEVLSRVVLCLLTEEDPQPALYHRMIRVWRVLPQVSLTSQWLLEMGFTSEVLSAAGVGPQLGRCVVCGQSRPRDAVMLDASVGGWRCLTCHTGFAGTQHSVPPEAVEVLRLLFTAPQQVFRLSLSKELVSQLHMAWRHYVSSVIEISLPVGGSHSLTYAQSQ